MEKAVQWLSAQHQLPLTCSRKGTCCHGKMVRLNPWELMQLARARQMSVQDFRKRFCEWGGSKLLFNVGWNQQQACSQYDAHKGCLAHQGRPLPCRLFPLGRQKQGEQVQYMFQGTEFPCLQGCPEVEQLPKLSVAEYLDGQAVGAFEHSQDVYLEFMQNLAEQALSQVIESELAQSSKFKILKTWRSMGQEEPESLVNRLHDWIDLLMAPSAYDFSVQELFDPIQFAQSHEHWLFAKIQDRFSQLGKDSDGVSEQIEEYCIVCMGLSLHLARSLGADPLRLSLRWIQVAERHLTK